MRKAIEKVGLMIGLALGLSQLGCGANDATTTGHGPPPLTEEERAVTAKMAQGTLAEIDLPEEKIRFVEFEPGRVLVMHQSRIGGAVTHVAGEGKLTLDQIFRAYAPDREVPTALVQAMERVAAADFGDATESLAPAGNASGSPGIPAATQSEEIAGDQRISSALSSTIDAGWFTSNFCNVLGADWTWCHAVAWSGAYAAWTAHRTNSVTCGDTGAGRTKFFVSGSLKAMVDVPYGQCWTVGSYHGPHGWFGVNLERSLKHVVDWAESTVRFAGWMATEDQFLGNGY